MAEVLLADAADEVDVIQANLITAIADDDITLNALSITLEGAFMNVTFQDVTTEVDMPGGWRGRGHLTADPVNYLHMMARNAFGLGT